MDPKDDERRKFPRLHREEGEQDVGDVPMEDGEGEDDSDDEVFLIGDD